MSNGQRMLFIEPFAGVSGDMMLGALVDLGIPLSFMEERLRDLDLDDRIVDLFNAKLVEHQPFSKDVGAQFGFPNDFDYENSTMHA